MQTFRVDMKGIIYCYHCIPAGKKYIGQTQYEKIRQNYHKASVNRGERNKFYNALRKYGWENFIYGIIEEYDLHLLNEQETFYIEKYDSYKNGYNMTLGGDGRWGYKISDETKEKISKVHKGNPKSQEHKRKLSEAAKKRKVSDKWRSSVSAARKGRFVGKENHNYGKKWWTNGVESKLCKDCPGKDFVLGRIINKT